MRNMPGQPRAGFTLVELLVVMVIIAVVVSGVVFSIGVVGQDRELQREADRLVSLLAYSREQAELTSREYGLYCLAGGYSFVLFNPRTSLWVDLANDEVLRERTLPAGLSTRLWVEGREIVLPLAVPLDQADLKPQILLFSNGDVNTFELQLERADAGRWIRLAVNEQGEVSAGDISAGTH